MRSPFSVLIIQYRTGLVIKMNNLFVFSIVIPIYNTEKYLTQCIDSLLYQTCKDFQIIMINDGSTDSSGQIAREYADQYPERILYLEQPNQGQGTARNYGLRHVTTPYVTFLDSDDWWLPRTAEHIIDCIRKNQPDLIFTCPVVYDTATKAFSEWVDNKEVRTIFDQQGPVILPSDVPELIGTEITICRLVVKTSLLPPDGLLYMEGIKWEDVYPHFYLIHRASSCVLLENAGFVYRINHGNQTTSASEKTRFDLIPAFDPVFRLALKENWSEYEIGYAFRMFMTFIVWFLNIISKEYYPDLVEQIHKYATSLPDSCFFAYCKTFQTREKKNKLLWVLLKDPAAYHMVKESQLYDFSKTVIKRLKGVLHK